MSDLSYGSSPCYSDICTDPTLSTCPQHTIVGSTLPALPYGAWGSFLGDVLCGSTGYGDGYGGDYDGRLGGLYGLGGSRGYGGSYGYGGSCGYGGRYGGGYGGRYGGSYGGRYGGGYGGLCGYGQRYGRSYSSHRGSCGPC